MESLSTLKFANRAKSIKNEARINEDLDQKSLLRRYERELKKLRQELNERSKSVVDNRKLLELDEQRRRAEEDKLAAIRTLEIRSQEFMREKQEKKRLEERITMLQAKILTHGAAGLTPASLQEIPAFRNALKEHQERIRLEYESRLADLERERETIEEEKAQVDRYKQLLLKQRDIMILLTQRLNERDEQIMALQDELDAYDRHQKELEEKLDEKTAALIHLQRVTLEQDAVSPVRNSRLAEALGPWASPGGGSGSSSGGGGGGARPGTAGARRPAAGGGGGGGGAGAGVPSSLLVTTKQFKPFEDDRAGDRSPIAEIIAESAGGGAGGEERLLSAEEKISELSRIVDAALGDRERLARDLEDVQAEKVQMETLLRERLERMVQTEIEVRLSAMRAREGGVEGGAGGGASLSAAAASAAGARAAALQEQLAKAQGELASARAALAARDAPAEDALRKLAHLRKEKEAISSIMENKISTLVDSIGAGIAASVPLPAGAPPPKWLRELGALDKLVKASIAALKAPQ